MSDALERLRKERSSTNPFESKLDFDRWCDEVKAVLADNPHARSRFANYAATAETMYAFKSDPIDAINNAIGLVNQVAKTQQQTLLKTKMADDAVRILEEPRECEEPDNHSNPKMNGVGIWLKKFWDAESTKIVSGLVLAGIFFFIKTYFGITLK